jgi:hypothetical protein
MRRWVEYVVVGFVAACVGLGLIGAVASVFLDDTPMKLVGEERAGPFGVNRFYYMLPDGGMP